MSASSSMANLQLYNKDQIFVDLTKQTTLEDSALPNNNVPKDMKHKCFVEKMLTRSIF